MDFMATARLAAGRAEVYEALTDFERLESRARAEGVRITRLAEPATLVGHAWRADFSLRGRARKAAITLADVDPGRALVFDARVGGLQAVTRIDLADSAAGSTDLTVKTDLEPHSLSARLIVQSLRLARARLAGRFADRVHAYAHQLDARLAEE